MSIRAGTYYLARPLVLTQQVRPATRFPGCSRSETQEIIPQVHICAYGLGGMKGVPPRYSYSQTRIQTHRLPGSGFLGPALVFSSLAMHMRNKQVVSHGSRTGVARVVKQSSLLDSYGRRGEDRAHEDTRLRVKAMFADESSICARFR